MLNKSNELKAMDYYERMKVESSPEEQASLRRELRILEDAGFISDEFHDELRRIRRKDKK
jgi:Fe2+ or Zn2+ uptake regulation protein